MEGYGFAAATGTLPSRNAQPEEHGRSRRHVRQLHDHLRRPHNGQHRRQRDGRDGEAAFEALSNVAVDDVTVVRSGSADDYTYTIEFVGALALTYAALTAADVDLAGGGDAVTVARTQGGPLATGWDLALSTDLMGTGGESTVAVGSNLGTSAFARVITGTTYTAADITSGTGVSPVYLDGIVTVGVALGGTIAEGTIILLVKPF